jgi:hypothetical protein
MLLLQRIKSVVVKKSDAMTSDVGVRNADSIGSGDLVDMHSTMDNSMYPCVPLVLSVWASL